MTGSCSSLAERRHPNLRTPEVLTAVHAQAEQHYHSGVVEKLRAAAGRLSRGTLTLRLAKEFGFCYGVERAIDLAYAASKVFQGRALYILGEIIHNPEVNEQLRALGIKNLLGGDCQPDFDRLGANDVVIVPAFGAQLSTVQRIQACGCTIVDTTCGDVMNVWKRVRQYARDGITSVVHGSAQHEETRATLSRATAEHFGHYLVVRTLEETNFLCEQICGGGGKVEFLERFKHAYSPGFDPARHLMKIGIANQTTMLRSETLEVQRRLRAAIVARDGEQLAKENFRLFDTICGSTQQRQDALRELLRDPLDLLLVVGGYNSSNTTHLVEVGEASGVPTYFIRNASRLESPSHILHYDSRARREIVTEGWLSPGAVTIGLTAGASCPNNVIEETILRLFAFRGFSRDSLFEETPSVSECFCALS
jgi:4-hydroxy-3-methylbut-2-enyl diphosphate reductase